MMLRISRIVSRVSSSRCDSNLGVLPSRYLPGVTIKRRNLSYSVVFSSIGKNRLILTRGGTQTIIVNTPAEGLVSPSSLIDQTTRHLVTNNTSHLADQLVPEELSERVYEEIAEESLESLYTYFDEIVERCVSLKDGDVSYGSGVLTVKLGRHGTYVINKQTPNKQIWLSSPTSGPKRYDFIHKTWIYRHDGVSMYQLLNAEIPKLVGGTDIDFENCSYGRRD